MRHRRRRSDSRGRTSDEKLELAKQFGATHGYNVRRQGSAGKDLFKLTGGGADYAFDCVGTGRFRNWPGAYCGAAALR